MILCVISPAVGPPGFGRLGKVAIVLSLSTTTGYAILATACLDGPGGSPVHVGYLANCTRIPKHYLSKIIQLLAAQGLLETKRGYKGGILLARPAEQITFLEVAQAIEGPNWIGSCLLGMPACWGKRACPTFNFWKKERKRIEAELRSTTLADMRAFKRRCPRTITPSRRRSVA